MIPEDSTGGSVHGGDRPPLLAREEGREVEAQQVERQEEGDPSNKSTLNPKP